jgi:hypothetical protein
VLEERKKAYHDEGQRDDEHVGVEEVHGCGAGVGPRGVSGRASLWGVLAQAVSLECRGGPRFGIGTRPIWVDEPRAVGRIARDKRRCSM